MTFKTVVVADSGPIRTITLRRPEHHNAMTPEMQVELIAALEEAAASGHRVLMLTGAGDAFCSGLDLTALSDGLAKTKSDYRADAQRTAKLFLALYEMPIPTIALVRGPALAEGACLALLCDFTLATPKATFAFTEVQMGYAPAFASVFLPMQLGEKRSRDLLLSGRTLSAEEAHWLGLVYEIVPPVQLLERVEALAGILVANSGASLGAAKRQLAAQNQAWLVGAIAEAIETCAESRLTADFRKGVAAFQAKRKPTWAK